MSLPALFLLYLSVFLIIIVDFVSIYFSMYSLKKFIFLENNTKAQEKIIKKIFLIAGILVLIGDLLVSACKFSSALLPEDSQLANPINILNNFSAVLAMASLAIGLVAIIYSSVSARKKMKWLGILSWIPMMGYITMIDALGDLLFKLIPLDVNSPHFDTYYNFFSSFINALFLALIFWMFYSKNRPAFIRKIEADTEDRSLSLGEEAAIWLIGIWMLIYYLIIDNAEDIPVWIANIGLLSNFVLGVVVTAFVIGNSYRKYYYEKNVKYQKTLITTMANLVESRDDNTGGHIQRTAKYVEIIARKLQKEGKFKELLTDTYINDMVVAAPLHDVGKIHISDTVLNKPGRLDDEEFRQMKSHSAAGGEIIGHVEEEVEEDISYLSIAKDMAEYHHERMDGNGYPHGIQGEEIPVCARILAVADVFDALISKRCYKDAMPLDQAFAIIKEETGDHFDTDIAQAFLDSREEVEQFLDELENPSEV